MNGNSERLLAYWLFGIILLTVAFALGIYVGESGNYIDCKPVKVTVEQQPRNEPLTIVGPTSSLKAYPGMRPTCNIWLDFMEQLPIGETRQMNKQGTWDRRTWVKDSFVAERLKGCSVDRMAKIAAEQRQ